VVPIPIVKVLFERGAFTATDTAKTAEVLSVFALGLPAFVMIKVFSPAYFAREDTKTPMRFAAISLVANTLGSVALFFAFRKLGFLPQLGIAVATTLGGWLNAGLLWSTLVKRGHFALDARMGRAFAAILFSSVVMGAALVAMAHVLGSYFASDRSFAVHVAALTALIAAGFAVYAAIVLATGTLKLRQLRKLIGRS
jgi:putative peptidoglycan lipid II flippase